jgi:hypothetical protein
VIETQLNLNAVLAAGWADPGDFPPEEFARAETFWESQRRQDKKLLATRAKAAQQIQEWTGRTPRDVGSVGIQTNLETSDLDLGIGYPAAERAQLIGTLGPHGSSRVSGKPGSTPRGWSTCSSVTASRSISPR